MKFGKKIILCSLFICFTSLTLTAQSVLFENNRILNNGIKTRIGNDVICPAGHGDGDVNVPPPAYYLTMKNARVKAGEKKSHFIVTYNGFTEQARTAFQRAVDIWEYILYSDVPIRIDAYWRELPNNVLGSANTSRWVSDFGAAKYVNTYYPIALAEKLAGKPINSDSESDIICNFNNKINWNYGSADQVTTSQYDLTTVVLHELGHGLGFVSTFYADDQSGTYGDGTSEFRTIYDIFVENGEAKQLINPQLFANNSTAMRTQLTSNNIFFRSLGSLGKPKLYAPSPFESGSSISHLDQTQYLSDAKNQLMTPAIRPKTAIHDPGPLVLKMMHKMGWEGTSIYHERLKNFESNADPITFKVNITADTSLVANSAKLYYQTNIGQDSVILTQKTGTDEFSAQVKFSDAVKDVRYRFAVKDDFGETVNFPGTDGVTNDLYVYYFAIGKDVTGPALIHYPDDILDATSSVDIVVMADDDYTGELKVDLKYSINDGSFTTVPLQKFDPAIHEPAYSQGSADEFTFLLIDAIKGLKAGDHIKYQLEGSDKNGNKTILPTQFTSTGKNDPPVPAFFEFTMTSLKAAVASYSTDFENAADDFATLGFKVGEETGFSSKALHSSHPYKNGLGLIYPGSNSVLMDFERNDMAMLRVPIMLSRNGNKAITFDELVLVEPGEPGAVMGSPDMYDYVVVEGLLLDGSSNGWIPLGDGYDSRTQSTWEKLFNSGNSGGDYPNSTAKGSSVYVKKRTINLNDATFQSLNNVPMLIRFRLYSDQLANGWGWMIDNLYVMQDAPVVLANETEGDTGITLFPNPADEFVLIKTRLSEPQKVRMEVFSMSGNKVIDRSAFSESIDFSYQLNLTPLPSGSYILKLSENKGQLYKRFIKL